MAGTLTIARKEFKDHVSDKAFLLCFAALLIAMVGGSFYYIQRVQDSNIEWSGRGDSIRGDSAWKFWSLSLVEWCIGQLSSLGVLVAIALSFNSINKERTEGSLKVLLSYPIYRDKIILGKLLAGLIVISLVTIASMTIAFSIVMFSLSIPLTLDFFLRIARTTLMGIVLLTCFLCIGTAISTVLRDTSAILLSLLLVATILRYENYKSIMLAATILLSGLGVDLIRPGWYTRHMWRMWYDDKFYRFYSRLSPVEAFLKLSERLFNFGKVYEWTPYGTEQDFIPFQVHLLGNLDLVAVPIIFTVAAFIACYILFTRRDVA